MLIDNLLKCQLPNASGEEYVKKCSLCLFQLNQDEDNTDSSITVNGSPYELADKLAVIIEQKSTIKSLRIEKELSFILKLPDELISFSNFKLSTIDKVTLKLADILHNNKNEEKIKILEILIPLYLRCNFTDLNSKPVMSLFKELKNHVNAKQYFAAIQIRLLIEQLKLNCKKNYPVSGIIPEICNLMYNISITKKCKFIIPFLAKDFVLSIKEIYNNYFSGKSVEKNCERAALLMYIPYSIMMMAAIYPPALYLIEWNSILQKFYKDSYETVDIIPIFEFCRQFPEKCKNSYLCANATAIMASISILSEKSDEGLHFIHKLATSSMLGQQSVAISFLIISKYDFFHDLFTFYKDQFYFHNGIYQNIVADILNDNLMLYIHKLEAVYELSKISYIEFESNLRPIIESTIYFNEFNEYCTCSISNLARSIDSIILKLDSEMLKKLSAKPIFFSNIQSYIVRIMSSGRCLIEIRDAIPFAHLCASYMQLIDRLKIEKMACVKLVSTVFVISMFDYLISCFNPLSQIHDEKNHFNSFNSMMYLEILRFCEPFKAKKDNFFFQTLFATVVEEHPSFRYAAIVMLQITLSNNDTPISNYDWKDFSPYEIALDFIKSDNPIVHNKAIECLTMFIPNLPESLISHMFGSIIEMLAKKCEHSEKILAALSKMIMENSRLKLLILMVDEKSELARNILNYTKYSFDESIDQRPLFAVDILYALCSYSIAPEKRIDKERRIKRNTLDYQTIQDIIAAFMEILNDEIVNPRFYLKIARSVCKLADNKGILTEIMRHPLNITFQRLRTSADSFIKEILIELCLIKDLIQFNQRNAFPNFLNDMNPEILRCVIDSPDIPKLKHVYFEPQSDLNKFFRSYKINIYQEIDRLREMSLPPRAAQFLDIEAISADSFYSSTINAINQ